MADDTLTVEQAKEDLREAIRDIQNFPEAGSINAAIDALIAAVRAEREPDTHTKRVMAEVDAAIDDEFR